MAEGKRFGALALGAAVLAALWLGPLPEMSRTAFSAHMLLHLGLVNLAAPLIALGLLQMGAAQRLFPPLVFTAILASVLDLVVVWGWHVPALHEAAARHLPVFALQQASFLFAGVAVWATSFSGKDGRSAALGVLAMFLTFTHMSMLGILLGLSPTLLYDPDLCIGAFGFTRLDDQRLGGVMMAVAGGLPYLLGGMALGWRLLSRPA